MLSIQFIREHADVVRANLEKRKDTEKLAWVDALLKDDEEHRKLIAEVQELRRQRNVVSEELNKLKKEGKDIAEQIQKAKAIPQQIKEVEEQMEAVHKRILEKQMRLPNILHESVPFGEGEEGNQVVKSWGDPQHKELKPHGEWLEAKGQADFARATKISGGGFYLLKDKIAMLDFALQKYAMDKLMNKGYTLITPPFMMNREPYEGVTDLADFENVMYKIEGEDQYLIATSEHPIGGMHMGETIDTLPIKYAGISSCFRKEIGSHGVDTKGLFRVHQFNKIEMFIFCKPEDSWMLHEELLANAEEIYQELELPYRVVNICTGDIGIVAAKKYDIEVWMPREKAYREVVSCSNCTAYQATRLGIKYPVGEGKEYLHTLNSTAIATSRTIRAIIENHQDEQGVVHIPKALHPYMNGITQI